MLGIDNLNNYYDRNLKLCRLNEIDKGLSKLKKTKKSFSFHEADITNLNILKNIFSKFQPNKVVNLAAQAGVRYSLKSPQTYINSNVTGFMNILECSRAYNVKGLIYASSSSVYGNNQKTPFSIFDRVDKPLSIYAASKRSNELMAYTYSHLYQLSTTGLRFFSVYGPWGRPDMAMYIFAKNIYEGRPIVVFNYGNMNRDFTYIDDVISGIISAIEKNHVCEIFNLGNSNLENIMDMVNIIEKELSKKATINFENIQPGDVKESCADVDYSKKKLGFKPSIPLSEGIPKFIDWFKFYHKIK